MATSTALPAPLTDASDLIRLESSAALQFPTFTAATAWTLGTALRTRIQGLPAGARKPALVSITLTHGDQTVFQSVTDSGTGPDNEVWARRKRNTVLRFGLSSWAMRMKMLAAQPAGWSDAEKAAGVEPAFAKKYALAATAGVGSPADGFAIHGGGFPIRVRGVDGIVGVVVVSGLKQEDDHQVIFETVKEVIEGLDKA